MSEKLTDNRYVRMGAFLFAGILVGGILIDAVLPMLGFGTGLLRTVCLAAWGAGMWLLGRKLGLFPERLAK